MAKKIIYTEDAPDPIGPYSQAVFVNNTLYISGQIAIDPFSESLILSDIESETKQVMKNIGFILDAAEMDFSNVVKCSIFLKDMNDFHKVNAIYGSYVKESTNNRKKVQVAKFPRNVKVEISTIAVR